MRRRGFESRGSSGRGRRDEGVRAGEEGEEPHLGRQKDWTAPGRSLRRGPGRYSNAEIDLGRSDAIDEANVAWLRDPMEHEAAVPKAGFCWLASVLPLAHTILEHAGALHGRDRRSRRRLFGGLERGRPAGDRLQATAI